MYKKQLSIGVLFLLVFATISNARATSPYIDEINKGVQYLISHQNTDGGWGGAPSAPSSIDDTCNAIFAILTNGSYPALSMENAKIYLLNQRNASGVWSDIRLTALATYTLSRIGYINQTLVNWILSAQSDDGTWSAYGVEHCALIITYLMLTGVESVNSHIKKTVDYILSQQQPDYLWGGIGAAVPGRVITALALAHMNATMNATRLEPAINRMLAYQRPNGAFYSTYPSTTDIYATEKAITGLMTCNAQILKNNTILQKIENACTWVLTQQGVYGGFIDPFNGDQEAPGTTCSGILSLAVGGGQPPPYGISEHLYFGLTCLPIITIFAVILTWQPKNKKIRT